MQSTRLQEFVARDRSSGFSNIARSRSKTMRTFLCVYAIALLGMTSFAAPKRLQVQDVRIAIQPTGGVVPAAITRPHGPFVLIVVNETSNPHLQIRLDDEKQNHLKNIAMSDFYGDWNELLDLAPGTYILSEATNQKIRCVITITSN